MIKIIKYGSSIINNTDRVIMVDNEDLIGMYSWDEAFKQIKLLNSLNYKGYNNWRLPNKEELKEILQNKDVIDGGFSGDYYWSSSEYSSYFAWGQYFGYVSQGSYGKDYYGYVRAVRDI